ncbi:MAG: DUF1761 domain-containing protein [Microbacterium sp.]|nr:DUF1761 domain-containing protein [Microbacterium sp.]
MFTVLAQLNWLAILVAFIVSAALAAVYFPVLIAKPYAVALGRQDAPSIKGTPVSNLGPVVCVLLITITSAVLLRAMDVTDVGEAVVFALIVGVGYLTVMTFQIAINPNFPRPLLYGLINAPYFILSSILTAIIVTLIR